MPGFNIEHLLESGGLLAVAAIIFAESGLLVGFFLPGDTLLLSAGYFASIGKLPIGWLVLIVIAAAVIGDNVGYTLGKHTGKRIFRKQESAFFHPDQLVKAEKFYEKHGGKTIIMARFIPIVRTFAPVVAGAGKMPHRRFMTYNFVGATLWAGGVTFLGYMLGKIIGSRVQNIDKYLMFAVVGAIAITVLPALYHIAKSEATWHKVQSMKASAKAKVSRKRTAPAPAKTSSDSDEA